MKEVIVIVRLNKVNMTKNALLKAGFPAFTCRKILGRGKQAGQEMLIIPDAPIKASVVNQTENTETPVSMNLIPKRCFTLIVEDDDVQKVVNAIMDVNSTGNCGDGRIFVLPIIDAFRVRDGKQQINSESY